MGDTRLLGIMSCSQSTYPRIRKEKNRIRVISRFPKYLRLDHGTKSLGLTFDDNRASSGV